MLPPMVRRASAADRIAASPQAASATTPGTGPTAPATMKQRLEAELGEDEGVSRLGGLTRASVSHNLPLVVTNGSEMMTALGDPTRQAIFERLSVRPTAVGELAAALPVSRPAVSQHLKVLRDVGLVVDRQEGTRRIYEVDRAGLAVLRSYLDQFWNRSLAAFQTEVEQQERERDDGDD